MPICRFSGDYLAMGVTPVENIFIDQYLPSAPGDYVRVYLYGLMQCHYADGGMTFEKMARILSMSETDVKNAFAYWEQRGLVR